MIQRFPSIKRVFFTTFLILSTLWIGAGISSAAPTPSVISYQGFLTSATGTAQTGTTTVTIRIYDASTAGTLLFEELHPTTPITNGYFTVQIGNVGDVSGGTTAVAITDLTFDRSYYVTVELASPFSTGEMTLAGGTRSQLGTVPFATVAYGALQATSSTGIVAQKGRLFFNTSSNELTLYNGTAWAPVVVQGTSTSFSSLTVSGQTTLSTASATNLTISSSLVSNTLTVSSATSTTLFATLLNAVTGTITNLFFTSATGTSLSLSSSLTSDSLLVASATATDFSSSNLYVTGVSTLATTTASSLTLSETLYGVSGLFGTTNNTFDSSKLVVQGTTTLIGSASSPTALRVIGNIDNTATSTFVPRLLSESSVDSGPLKLFIVGNYVYSVNHFSSTLTISDVSDPLNPTLIASSSVGGSPWGVYVSGRYAYTANTVGSISVVDVSNPYSPSLASTFSLGAIPRSIYISGKYAYVPGTDTGYLYIIDISDPRSLRLSASLYVGINPYTVHVSGRYAYVASPAEGTLSIVDITNPISPVIASSTVFDSEPTSVYVSGKYAYVTERRYEKLFIFDVSNPASPVIKSEIGLSGADPSSVYVSGRYAYVTHNASGAYAKVSVVDIASSTNPIEITAISTMDYPRDVVVSGRYMYVANETNDSFSIYDLGGLESTSALIHSLEAGNLSVRNNISLDGMLNVGTSLTVGSGGFLSQGDSSILGSLTVSGTSTDTLFNISTTNNTVSIGTSTPTFDSSKLVVQGTTTLIGSASSPTALRVIGNIDNTATSTFAPRFISSVGVQGAGTFEVYVDGSYAYVANNVSNNLSIIDISNKNNPVFVSTTTVGLGGVGVTVRGKYAYVTAYDDDSFNIVDVSNVKAPTVVSSLVVAGQPYGLDVSGSYAYVTIYNTASVSVIDISAPNTPKIVGTIGVGTNPQSIAISGKYAYVTNRGSGSVSVLDITNPISPTVVATLSAGDGSSNLEVSGRYLYVANAIDGTLTVADVANPAVPVMVATLGIGGGDVLSLDVSGRYAYVTNSANSFITIDISDPSNPYIISTSSFVLGVNSFGTTISGRYAYVTSQVDASLTILDLGGLESTSALIHSLEAGNLSVRNDISLRGMLNVGTSLTVGSGGFFSQGNSSILGSLTLSSTATGSPAFIIRDGAGVSTFEIRTGTSSLQNSFIGVSSGEQNTTGYGNSFLGYRSGISNTGGWNNVANGSYSLYSNTTGSDNVANGSQSLYFNTEGESNVANGTYALYSNTAGSMNAGSGDSALYSNATGSYNTSFGAYSLYNIGSTTPSYYNTALGYNVGVTQTSGDSNIIIGANTELASTTGSYQLNIGNILFGQNINGTGTAISSGNLAIGTSTPSAKFSVQSFYGDTGTLFDVASTTSAGFATSSLFKILANGNVAIGTSTASSRLDIYNDTSATSTDMFRILSDVGAVGNVIYTIKANGDIFTDGNTTIGTPADLAENYPTGDDSITRGMVVSLATTTATWSQSLQSGLSTDYQIAEVKKATAGEEALGIISTRPGILLGGNTERGIPVAFSGRVPVYVSDENGVVHIGDSLTISSSTPGYAMKQTASGPTLGRALSNQDESSTSSLVMVLVENKEHTIAISGTSGLTLLDTAPSPSPTTVRDSLTQRLVQGYSIVKEYVAIKVSAVTGYFDTVFAREVYTDTLCVKKSNGQNICLNGDQVENVLNATNVPLLQNNVVSGETSNTSVNVVTPPDDVSQTSSSTSESQIDTPPLIDPVQLPDQVVTADTVSTEPTPSDTVAE
jgi:hypothetical protein